MEQLRFPITQKEAEKIGVKYSSRANKNAVFPSRLRELRKAKNLSQADLAASLKVSKSTIGLYETGDTLPDVKTASELATGFGVSIDYLIGKSDARTADFRMQQICDYTGLSSTAIELLGSKQKSTVQTSTLSYLIEEGTFLKWLSSFVWLFSLSKLPQSKYRHVPVKAKVQHSIADLTYSVLIRSLPKFKERFEKKHNGDWEAINSVLFEYLRKNADLQACVGMAGDPIFNNLIPPDYSDEFFANEDDYDAPYFFPPEGQDEIMQEAEEDWAETCQSVHEFLTELMAMGA